MQLCNCKCKYKCKCNCKCKCKCKCKYKCNCKYKCKCKCECKGLPLDLSGMSWPFHGLRRRDIHGLLVAEVMPGPGLLAGGATSSDGALCLLKLLRANLPALLNRGRQGTCMQLIAWACNAELASGCVGVFCTSLSHYLVKKKM